jgi:hypothetical protein
MPVLVLQLIALVAVSAAPLAPGNRDRLLKMGAQSIAIWVKVDGCASNPSTEKLPNSVEDGTSVTKQT